LIAELALFTIVPCHILEGSGATASRSPLPAAMDVLMRFYVLHDIPIANPASSYVVFCKI